MRPNRSLVLLLALILLFGLLARLWDINRESFWADEGWTMLLARGPTLADVTRTMADDQHPPLYFALLHGWMRLLGNSEIMTRLLSTFWSLIGIALVYRLGADLFSPGAGLAAALLLALTDNDIMLAREARHYAQMATLAAASALFYLRYLRRPTRLNGVGWLLAAAALMYTHYLGAFVLVIQAGHALVLVRPARRLADIFIRLAAIGAAWLPWAFVFLNQSLVRYTRPILFQSTMPNTPEAFAIVRGDLVGSHWGLTVGLLLLGLVYVTYRDGRPHFGWRPARPTLYLALWVAFPIAVIVLLNERFPILTTRNFLLVTPAIAVLIGHGLMNLDRSARTFALTVLVIVGLLTVDAYLLKPPWRAVAQDILQYREGDEPIIMDVWTDDFALRYHIGRTLNADPDTLPLISMPEWREAYQEHYFAYLLEYLRDKESFWLAYWGKNEDNLLGFFVTHGFARTGTQIETHRDEEIYVYRYDRIGEPTLARFGDVFALKRATLDRERLEPAGSLRVNLLWEALRQPPVDYSISAFVLDAAGQLIAQQDGPPLSAHTTQWKPGDIQFDSHTLRLPADLPPGEYTVGIKVYWYVDPVPLPVSGSPDPAYFPVGLIQAQVD